MIYLYTGTPGSGKSLDVARDIVRKLKKGENVIANFEIDERIFKHKGKFIYKPDSNDIRNIYSMDYLTVNYLVDYAKNNHIPKKEGQTLIVIDECQRKFNPRDMSSADRNFWIEFFCTHRHLGFNVILITQNDRLVDKQIRVLAEYEVKHRKMNNFKLIGLILTIFRIPLFAAIDYWYGVRERIGMRVFIYRKVYSRLYDSYRMFEGLKINKKKDENKEATGGEERSGGAPPEAPLLPGVIN